MYIFYKVGLYSDNTHITKFYIMIRVCYSKLRNLKLAGFKHTTQMTEICSTYFEVKIGGKYSTTSMRSAVQENKPIPSSTFSVTIKPTIPLHVPFSFRNPYAPSGGITYSVLWSRQVKLCDYVPIKYVALIKRNPRNA